MNKILNFCKKVIAAVGSVAFVILSYYSFCYTSLKQYNNTLFESRDNLLLHVLTVGVIVGISGGLYHVRHKISAKAVHVLAAVFSGLVFFLCIFLYTSAEFQPIVDQGHVFINAAAIADREVGYYYRAGILYFIRFSDRVDGIDGIAHEAYRQYDSGAA